MLSIRKTTYKDIDELKDIFNHARKIMKENNNPSQWGDNRPDFSLIMNDIDNNQSYIVLDDELIVGTFALIEGIEPTYIDIDGKWLNDNDYLTIHRIASNGKSKGIFDFVIEYASKFNKDIRIDTHFDNTIMRHLIQKNGFIECGIIIVDDGTPRIAYQKTL